MIKGLTAALAASLIIAAIIMLILNFFEIIAQFAIILGIGFIFAAIILFVLFFFIFGVILFVALFYYLAEKKPNIQPGDYKLEEEKGKNE